MLSLERARNLRLVELVKQAITALVLALFTRQECSVLLVLIVLKGHLTSPIVLRGPAALITVSPPLLPVKSVRKESTVRITAIITMARLVLRTTIVQKALVTTNPSLVLQELTLKQQVSILRRNV